MADLSGANTTSASTNPSGITIDPNLSPSDIPLYGDPAFNAFMAKSGYTNQYLTALAQQKANSLNAALQASLAYQDQANQRTQGQAASGQAARGLANSSQYLGQQAAIQGAEAQQRANAINNTANQISSVQQNLVNQIIAQQQNAAQQGVNAGAKIAASAVPNQSTSTSNSVSQ